MIEDASMSNLLKGKRVFVDTTEFSTAQFSMQSPVFVELARLCRSGRVVLLTTDITRREIEAGVRNFANRAIQTVYEAAKVADVLVEPEALAVKSLERKLTHEDLLERLSKGVDSFFKECQVVTLAIPPDAATQVFDLYFGRHPPFGGNNKKMEFPDAFVLQALKAAIDPHDEVLYLVSADSDLEKACQGVSKLEHLISLSRLMDLIHRHDAAVKQINATVKRNLALIEARLESILKSLPPDVRDAEGSVTLHSVELSDVLDTLIVSCESDTAAVEFVLLVEIDALLESVSSPGDGPDFRNVHDMRAVSISLVFRFKAEDDSFFEVLEVWTPGSLSFWLHG